MRIRMPCALCSVLWGVFFFSNCELRGPKHETRKSGKKMARVGPARCPCPASGGYGIGGGTTNVGTYRAQMRRSVVHPYCSPACPSACRRQCEPILGGVVASCTSAATRAVGGALLQFEWLRKTRAAGIWGLVPRAWLGGMLAELRACLLFPGGAHDLPTEFFLTCYFLARSPEMHPLGCISIVLRKWPSSTGNKHIYCAVSHVHLGYSMAIMRSRCTRRPT
jgi:hypothetical protein